MKNDDQPWLQPVEPTEPPPTIEAGKKRSKPKHSKKHSDRFSSHRFAVSKLAEMDRAEIGVYMVLWDEVRDGVSSVSMTTLCRYAGICRRTASKAIKRLIEIGVIERISKGNNITHVSARYRMIG
jgi:Fic family protein